MENYSEEQKEFHSVFVDLKKANYMGAKRGTVEFYKEVRSRREICKRGAGHEDNKTVVRCAVVHQGLSFSSVKFDVVKQVLL